MKLRKQLIESIPHSGSHQHALERLEEYLYTETDHPLHVCNNRMYESWLLNNPPIVFDLSGDKPRAAYCTQFRRRRGHDSYWSSSVSSVRLDYANSRGDLRSFWVSDLHDEESNAKFVKGGVVTALACLSPEDTQAIGKLRYIDHQAYDITYNNPRALYSDFMTVPKAVNGIRQAMGLEPATPQENNAFLQRIHSICADSHPVALIPYDRDISDIYHSEPDDQFGSCMASNHPNYFAMYDDLQSQDRLKMLVVYPSKSVADEADGVDGDASHIGRALLWCDESGTPKWIDRVYAHSVAGSLDTQTLEVVEQWCRDNGIEKTVSSAKNPYLLSKGFTHATIRIPAPKHSPHQYHKVPYVDSLSYWCDDGFLRNTDSHEFIAEFDQTDGGYSGGAPRVEDYRGNMIDEDDAVSYYAGGYIDCNEAAELSEYHYGSGEYAAAHEVTRDWRGAYILDEHRNRCLDGEWAHDDDAIALYDGTYAHPGMGVTTLHDGETAADDYHDIVQLHGGQYAIKSGCVEASDGQWVLADDLAEYEASIAIEESEPEPQEQTV